MQGIFQEYFLSELVCAEANLSFATHAARIWPLSLDKAFIMVTDPERAGEGYECLADHLDMRRPIEVDCIAYYLVAYKDGVWAWQEFYHPCKRSMTFRECTLSGDGALFKEDDLGFLLGDKRFKGIKGLQFIA